MSASGTAAEQYARYGFTVVWAMSATEAALHATKALSLMDALGIRREGIATGGGRSSYGTLDGEVCKAEFPSLMRWYGLLPARAESIVGRALITSPYPRSALNVKAYRAPDGGQGWHFDTNPVSAVLYLSTGSPTVVEALTGSVACIRPEPGRLLLMQGRRCQHFVPPSPVTRVAAVANLYHPDDVWRPSYIDDLVYGASGGR